MGLQIAPTAPLWQKLLSALSSSQLFCVLQVPHTSKLGSTASPYGQAAPDLAFDEVLHAPLLQLRTVQLVLTSLHTVPFSAWFSWHTPCWQVSGDVHALSAVSPQSEPFGLLVSGEHWPLVLQVSGFTHGLDAVPQRVPAGSLFG